MRDIRLGQILVRIFDDTRTVTTVFPDGAALHASPEPNPEYEARATALGYTGPDRGWQMCVDHEIAHQWLAVTRHALPWSWTVWDVAHRSRHLDDTQHAAEEAEVHLPRPGSTRPRRAPGTRRTRRCAERPRLAVTSPDGGTGALARPGFLCDTRDITLTAVKITSFATNTPCRMPDGTMGYKTGYEVECEVWPGQELQFLDRDGVVVKRIPFDGNAPMGCWVRQYEDARHDLDARVAPVDSDPD